MQLAAGICIGASSVKLAIINRTSSDGFALRNREVQSHNGSPQEIIKEFYNKYNLHKIPVTFTGRKFRSIIKATNISEPEATEIAYSKLFSAGRFDAIASLGSETFLVYTLDRYGKISGVITKNQCASGTGEFFLQQIKRMNLSLDEINNVTKNAKPFRVSGRCSVFCKSDCTHALNKGVPKAEVAAGLSQMIAEKAQELFEKQKIERVLLLGGVTRNSAVMKFLQAKYPNAEVSEYSEIFEAFGAALYASENEIEPIADCEQIFRHKESSFAFLPPLEKYADKVQFEQIDVRKAKDGERCIIGLDVGSTTTKAVAISIETKEILAKSYLYTYGNPIEAAKNCYRELRQQLPDRIEIIGIGTTGSGRHIAALHAETEAVINEITAHSTAAVHFNKDVDTIFEIGGQDAKYTYIVNRVPADYAMNEACSAGTGSFLEEAANESLKVALHEIEQLAMNADNPPNFSDQCAAFIGSDIKTAQQEGISRENIVAGLVYSVCMNYANRVKGNRPVGNKIFMQGGVCYNRAVPIAMAAITGKEIIVPPEPGLMGAYGVALDVLNKINLGIYSEKKFDLDVLINREVIYKKPFICRGGKEKCDLKCTINLIQIEDRTYPFGGACDKYYSINLKRDSNISRYDYVSLRNHLFFEKYAPESDLPSDAKTIGINNSFLTHSLYPLFYNFFTQLGFRVIIPENPDKKGFEREISSFCFPAQLSLGLMEELLNLKPDYVFLPAVFEMNAGDREPQRLDFNCTCVFVSGEAFYLRQAFKDRLQNIPLLTENFNFANGFEREFDKFYNIAVKIGISGKEKVRSALEYAIEMQHRCQQEAFELGRKALKEIGQSPDKFGVVLVGRHYNTFPDFANKGIPQKYASRGIYVLPFDLFDCSEETIDDNMFWEAGKRILRIGKFIKKHKQLFATYITNFSCGPDSMIISSFRNIMKDKPSLTLELDSHSADAGINTRIDASIDIINNYLRINKSSQPKQVNLARIEFAEPVARFVRSSGETVPLNDPSVEILIPSMGELSAKLFAAALRSLGFRAKALEVPTPEVLKLGRANCTGKECLPLIIMVGLLMDYIENHWDGRTNLAYFTVQGAGNCRLGQYPVFIRQLLERRGIENVAQMVLMNEDGFAGLGENFALRGIQAILAADVIEDIRNAILANAENPDKGIEIFENEFDNLIHHFEQNPEQIYSHLENFAYALKNKIPARIPIEKSRYIAFVGEIYVRRDHFAHKWLNEYFAKRGFVLLPAHISEWIFYVDYLLQIDLLESEKSLRKKFERQIRNFFMRDAERKIKKTLEKSGYYKFHRTEIEPILKHSRHLLPYEFKGEPGLTLGIALKDGLEKYCGIINFGPFTCMPTRFTEAVGLPEMNTKGKLRAKTECNQDVSFAGIFDGIENIPFLTIETDGNVYSQIIEARLETFALAAERVAQARERRTNGVQNLSFRQRVSKFFGD
ncbi:MAG: acyl-CoA dehydratase activase [Bacteroidota bacterium]